MKLRRGRVREGGAPRCVLIKNTNLHLSRIGDQKSLDILGDMKVRS